MRISDWSSDVCSSDLIPDAHHDISEADILYAAPFALDNHDIVKADGFGKGHLNTGNEVFKRRLRGGTEDEASDTGRGHQRDSNGTHPRYRHQHHGNGNEANDKLGDPMKDSHPSATAARAQIIGNADVAPQLHDVPQCADQAESHPADQRSNQNAPADRPIAAERRSQPDGSKTRTKADQRNQPASGLIERSEERRVGNECGSTCRSQWSTFP